MSGHNTEGVGEVKEISKWEAPSDVKTDSSAIAYARGWNAAREKMLARVAELESIVAEAKAALTLRRLREANIRRAVQWNPLGAKIPLSFALMELAGEVGEACNAGKKLARHELGLVGGVSDVTHLREELADVVICVDLVAIKAGIDLEKAVVDKFNATSRKHGFTVMLGEAAEAARAGEGGGA